MTCTSTIQLYMYLPVVVIKIISIFNKLIHLNLIFAKFFQHFVNAYHVHFFSEAFQIKIKKQTLTFTLFLHIDLLKLVKTVWCHSDCITHLTLHHCSSAALATAN